MKNLILVIGRSGAGKDTLVRYVQSQIASSAVPSYTDRPIRPTETEGVEHTFLTKEGFDDIMKTEHALAYTQIGETGYRYCTTVEQIDKLPNDTIFYVIDPQGYYFCKKNADKFNLKVIYVTAPEELRKERAIKRNGDTETYLKRCADEDAQFAVFEKNREWDALVENDDTLEEVQTTMLDIVKDMIKTNIEKRTVESVGYYAVITSKYTTAGDTLYFWHTNFARRGIPSDYGWSSRPSDKTVDDSLENLQYFLNNTLALDIDRGDWDEDEIPHIEIRKISTQKIITEVDEPTTETVSMDKITEIGEEEYGWNGKEPYNVCPRCGEDGWQGSNCPNCGYDLH